MAIICDTSGVFAIYDHHDRWHEAAEEFVASQSDELLLPVILLAEIDYLITDRLGQAAALDFLESVRIGAFQLLPLSEISLGRCMELLNEYADLKIGLSDASVVAAAEERRIFRLFTTDERHFRAIRPRGSEHFTLLPADL